LSVWREGLIYKPMPRLPISSHVIQLNRNESGSVGTNSNVRAPQRCNFKPEEIFPMNEGTAITASMLICKIIIHTHEMSMISLWYHTSSIGRLGYFFCSSFSLAARMVQYQFIMSCNWTTSLVSQPVQATYMEQNVNEWIHETESFLDSLDSS